MCTAIQPGEATKETIMALLVKRYEIGAAIARGREYSIVRMARCRKTGRDVVFKVMPACDPQTRAAREREADLQMRASRYCARVVQFVEAFYAKDLFILVMEHCRGGDLLQRVNDHGPYSERAARHMFRQIVDALADCYAIGISHRDVKLDNILVTREEDCCKSRSRSGDGDGGEDSDHDRERSCRCRLHLKLADFGFSSGYKPGVRYRNPCGSTRYAAPELFLHTDGAATALLGYDGQAADVWSAGVVLYCIVFGVQPFDDESDADAIEAIVSGDYAVPHRVSPALDVLLGSMLDTRPERRPSFAQIQRTEWYLGEEAAAMTMEMSTTTTTTMAVAGQGDATA